MWAEKVRDGVLLLYFLYCIWPGDAEPGADVPRRHPRARGGAPQEPGPAHVLHRQGRQTRAQAEGGGREDVSRGARHSLQSGE